MFPLGVTLINVGSKYQAPILCVKNCVLMHVKKSHQHLYFLGIGGDSAHWRIHYWPFIDLQYNGEHIDWPHHGTVIRTLKKKGGCRKLLTLVHQGIDLYTLEGFAGSAASWRPLISRKMHTILSMFFFTTTIGKNVQKLANCYLQIQDKLLANNHRNHELPCINVTSTLPQRQTTMDFALLHVHYIV